ncbi:MAG: DUF4862 family protein [Elusimicrobiota bacterium]|nr:MAG: DUF4862 family protein [Elusimicrobiota bacterium]
MPVLPLLHFGAYAASAGLDESAEAALYKGIEALGAAGLEVPFTGKLHPRDEGWLTAQIRPDWTIVLTILPGEMDRLAKDKHFGLASADEGGRARALDFAESARLAVERLNKSLGRAAVIAVQVHSAPRLGGSGAKSSLEKLAASLSDLRARDWSGARLLLEHCDAAVPDHAPDKGFLRIEDEVMAAKLSAGKTPLSMSINWGRSAVETRSAAGPVSHIERAVQADLLGALFFRGRSVPCRVRRVAGLARSVLDVIAGVPADAPGRARGPRGGGPAADRGPQTADQARRPERGGTSRRDLRGRRGSRPIAVAGLGPSGPRRGRRRM